MVKLKGKNVLVTGGAGFIGSHLVDALIEERVSVRVLDDLSSGKFENISHNKNNSKFEFVLGSVLSAEDIMKAVKDMDIIFHLACLGVRHSIKYPFENHRVNAEGALLVLDASYKIGVEKFIYCSSSEVYGSACYVPMPESHPTNPHTVYGASKLAGEVYTQAYSRTYGLKAVTLRSFNTYGPRSHHEGYSGEMIPKSIVRVLNKKPIFIFGDGSQTRDYTYVEDVVRAFINAASCDELIGLVCNIGSNFEISIKKIAEMIFKISGGLSPDIEYLDNRPGDVSRLYADATLFHKLTGWRPQVSLERGLLKTIEWFRTRSEGPSVLLSEEKGINWE